MLELGKRFEEVIKDFTKNPYGSHLLLEGWYCSRIGPTRTEVGSHEDYDTEIMDLVMDYGKATRLYKTIQYLYEIEEGFYVKNGLGGIDFVELKYNIKNGKYELICNSKKSLFDSNSLIIFLTVHTVVKQKITCAPYTCNEIIKFAQLSSRFYQEWRKITQQDEILGYPNMMKLSVRNALPWIRNL